MTEKWSMFISLTVSPAELKSQFANRGRQASNLSLPEAAGCSHLSLLIMHLGTGALQAVILLFSTVGA